MKILESRRAVVTVAALLLTLSACGSTTGGAVSTPNDNVPAPVIEGDLSTYAAAAESLLVRPLPESAPKDLVLVFYRGRGVDRDAAGTAFVPDPRDSRVLLVGPDMTVSDVVGGPTEAGGGLGQPLSAAPTPDGGLFVADVEHDGGLLYYRPGGEFAGSAAPPVSNPDFQTGPDGSLWAARSPYLLRFEETPTDAPLLYRFDPLAGTGVGIANIETTAAPTWLRATNAGPITVGPDGTAYFAFFLRNEVRAYAPDGELKWRSTRGLHYETYQPVFAGEGADLRYNVRPVTQALSMGPDGLVYALTATDSVAGFDGVAAAGGVRRLEVWDGATGALVRATTVPGPMNTFAADPDGRVYVLDAMRIDDTAPAPERPPLRDVPLVSFEGDTTRFADHRGKALLVNFWASWCLPCRDEIPQLKAYYATLDTNRVEFLAISVDEDRQAGLDFIEPFELEFPIFHNGPTMQQEFRYGGLPFTLIVDPRGRIVEEIQGFGSAETWSHLTTTLEAEMPLAASEPAATGVDGDQTEHEGHGAHEGHVGPGNPEGP